jgi:hypothetical protein
VATEGFGGGVFGDGGGKYEVADFYFAGAGYFVEGGGAGGGCGGVAASKIEGDY